MFLGRLRSVGRLVPRGLVPTNPRGSFPAQLPWRAQLRSGSFPLLVAITLGFLIFRSPLLVWGDTWFNLVLGREVAAFGIIHTDSTTALGLGTPVVDIQWLAHLVFYAVVDQVGIAGLALIGAVWIGCSILLGGAMALRIGATPGRVLLTSLMVFAVLGSSLVLRAQTVVFPMLVLFPAILWRDARAPSARTWFLVPAAVLWANLHGSVLLAPIFGGALLAARALDARRTGQSISWRLAVRDGALTLALLSSIAATPYGLAVWRYYRQTAGNPIFREFVTEWWPLWASPDVEKVALLLVIAYAILRSWRRVDSFPLLVLGGLCLMQVTSIRHATPLALACLVLLPQLLDEALGQHFPMEFPEFSPRLAASTLAVTTTIFVIGLPSIVGKVVVPPGPASPEASVAAESGRQCILADEQQADRLMWYFPLLMGRLTHSARVETMPATFVKRLGSAYTVPDAAVSREFFRQYPLVAIDDRLNARVVEALSRDHQFEAVGTSRSFHVFRNRRAASLADPCAPSG
jgi:hypothetical protein